MKQPKRKSSYNDTYIYTKMEKNWKDIIADINKQWDYYTLWFSKYDEKNWIKIIKDIEKPFYDLELAMEYAEIFMEWYLSE